MDFEEFVRLACTSAPPKLAQVGRQLDFSCLRPDARTSHIFRYDRLEDFVHFLEATLDFEILLQRLNVSPWGDLHLSAESEAMVQTTFAADFDLYRSLPRRD